MTWPEDFPSLGTTPQIRYPPSCPSRSISPARARWSRALLAESGAPRLSSWPARGAFVVTDAAIPHVERERGSIVFVSSTAGQRGEARHSAYAASKGALISYTKSLAAELGPRGIRVNCVAPGWVETAMTAQTLADPAQRLEIEGDIPLGRIALPSDIAGPI